ncbi:RluA family pseudouridine synthase [Granulicella sp. 5B5]|uniref:RluA family pseudouridine synthase n=1 Tax=Granulicella sp. 5B5 TaxID=1617967 RepID=UPI0015F598B9|nr:RluA family pseudouridine synthase [Granulicella sp. 5B5]QMV18687.1 RluA family pseudouridine synthase [Granulicella sp. 5B5]
MPSKNMLPKGQRRRSVKAEYRAQRTLAQEKEAERKAAEADNFDEALHEAETELLATADFMEPELTMEERIATNNWFTTKGASGSKVAAETHAPPRYANPYAQLAEERPEVPVLEDLDADEEGVRTLTVAEVAKGMRLDAYLAKALPEISRARVTLLIDNGQVTLDGKTAKSSYKLKGGEIVEIEGDPRPAPMNATAEDIPLTIVYEDDDLAVIDKPAGMMVHAGSGSAEHNSGTLVNALLFHLGKLSKVGGDLRPGIVHRLDKQTSGLIVVAKNDVTHRKLSEMFSERELRKVYVALVHGHIAEDEGTVRLAIARDLVRRTRMTTKRAGGRNAVSNWRVLERLETPYGPFTLVEVHIETGRTHQIRVHMQAIGHSVVGDFLYGAPHLIQPLKSAVKREPLELERNFLHAAELEFEHPRTGEALALRAELPEDLTGFLKQLQEE